MSTALRNPTLYVLDAHALIFQVFHAVGPMSSPSGLPTNALFGFTRYLFTCATANVPITCWSPSTAPKRLSATTSTRSTRPIAARCPTT